ncbi:hypothetical protein CC1G_09226 [Coprinopsis cinerea okayama7|uniref:Uncharacterized protein n=1 Tax=Coprinopsis cinerea (strain Okayama-7 / 130 / ATCC MYA-4618 / FGSC 9003) TaxID=240176 RepID=A8P500_COPC7|nr:hypothetical protein CC1G_09226 [Coprinopsis cinerea okayama7\|eukprot:XP_001838849.1 hypothetical protein CC1G_09226 [Coprinopsis cinerea okayama7\
MVAFTSAKAFIAAVAATAMFVTGGALAAPASFESEANAVLNRRAADIESGGSAGYLARRGLVTDNEGAVWLVRRVFDPASEFEDLAARGACSSKVSSLEFTSIQTSGNAKYKEKMKKAAEKYWKKDKQLRKQFCKATIVQNGGTMIVRYYADREITGHGVAMAAP